MNFLLPLLCVVHISSSLDFRLSTSKVLLPYFSYVSINYTLVAESDVKYCFKWSSTAPEVATVTPLAEECSQSAIITATWKNPSRASTAILVENKMTGHTVKCDVIVDKPSKLEIETTTQELYLHDAPEALVVRAFDDLGNIFSSLTGLPFEWSITSAHGVDGLNILRFISWTESEYEIPSVIGNLETQGLQGDQQLVGGIKTGSAFVGVSVKDSIYSGVLPGKVRLLVMANAMLKPGLAYLIPNASLDFQVLLFHQGNLNEVPMPSPQYYLSLNEKTKATLEIQKSRLTAKQIGEVEVCLYDRNIEESETFKRPKSIVSIVEPSYLTFTALPGRRWVLDTTRTYTVTIDVFDRNSHRIWPSDDLRLEAVFPKAHLRVLESSANGTWHRVQPLKPGPCIITARLAAVQTPDGVRHNLPTPVTGSQKVEIYDPVSVRPERVVLPWTLPSTASVSSTTASAAPASTAASTTVIASAGADNRSSCLLEASGGSGDYTWLSSNASSVMVGSRGYITAMAIGRVWVTAADVRNADNAARAEAVVAEPTGMAFLPAPVEAEIGTTLRLPIALYAGSDPMCSCSHAPIDLAFEDEVAVFEIVSGLEQQLPATCQDCGERGCAAIVVRALRKGFSRVVARYRGGLGDGTGSPITAEVMLGAFKPLRPVASSFVVSLGAQETVAYRGGPQPWVLDPATYRAEIVGARATVDVESVKDQHTGRSAFLVRCTGLGEFRLELATGNLPSAKNKFPAKRSVQVNFVCAVPTSLRLQPLLNLPTKPPGLPPCPAVLEDPSLPVPVHNYRPMSLRLAVLDAEGRQFTSLASLAISVTSSDPSVAVAAVADDSAPVPLIRVEPSGQNATVQITVTLSGYKSAYHDWISRAVKVATQAATGEKQQQLQPVSASAQLRTAGDAVAHPGQLISYHTRGRATAYLTDGSGHFYATEGGGGDPVVQGRFLSAGGDREVEATVVVHDLCMDRARPLEIPLLVVALRAMRLTLEGRVPLGGRESGTLNLLGRGDRPIPMRLLAEAGLQLNLRSEPPGLVTVVFDAEAHLAAADDSISIVRATGEAVGVARVQAECHGVRSNWAQVTVYPPLRLRPPNVTMLVGSQLQLQATGGPPAAALRFSAMTERGGNRRQPVAAVSLAGLVDATAEGLIQVRVESVGLDSAGNARVFSTALGWVSVVPLAELRVHAPVTAIKAGNCLPLWAVAQGGVGPAALATVTPPLYFHWSLDAEGQVARLSHFLSILGQPLRTKRMSAGVRLCGLSPGVAVVRLRLYREQQQQQQQQPQHEAQLSVRVLAALTVPGICLDTIRMAPGSSYDLAATREAGQIRYSLETAQQPQVVSLSPSGHLTATHSHGSALVTITAHSKWANQTLTLRVEVCPVAYLMLQYESPALPQMRADLHHLPTGGLYSLKAAAYASFGDPIHSVNAPLAAYTTRSDFAHLSDFVNQSFSLRAVAKGFTVLQVSHNGLEDFAVVFTAPAIEPHDVQIPAGAVLCFSSAFAPSEELRWASTNPQSVAVLSDSGLAAALAPGKTAITLNGRRFSASADVSVVEPLDFTATVPHGAFLSDSGLTPPVIVTIGPQASAASAAAFTAANCTGGGLSAQLPTGGHELLAGLLHCRAHFSDDLRSPATAATLPTLHAEPILLSSGRLACTIRVDPAASTVAVTTPPYWDTGISNGGDTDRPQLPRITVTAELPRIGIAAVPIAIPLWPAVRLGFTQLTSDESGTANLRLIIHPGTRQHLSVQAARPDLIRVMEPHAATADDSSTDSAAVDTSAFMTVPLRLTSSALEALAASPEAEAGAFDLRVIIRHQRTRQTFEVSIQPHASLLRVHSSGARQDGVSGGGVGGGLTETGGGSLLYIGIGALTALLVITFTVKLMQPPPQHVHVGANGTPTQLGSGADQLGTRSSLDRSGPVLWSQGYGYTSSGDFSPVSPFRRSPNTSGLGLRSRLAD